MRRTQFCLAFACEVALKDYPDRSIREEQPGPFAVLWGKAHVAQRLRKQRAIDRVKKPLDVEREQRGPKPFLAGQLDVIND